MIWATQPRVSLATATRRADWFGELSRVAIRWRCGGRCGTLHGVTLEQFGEKVGNPHKAVPASDYRRYGDLPLLDGAGKISAIWYFDTPRGLVQVSDYWWNPIDELSIRATDRRAMRWFLRWARANGLSAA